MVRPGWINAPRSNLFLQFLRDAVGFKAFPEMSMNPLSLLRYPVAETNNIPTTIAGAGAATASESYLVDFSDVIIGESSGLEVSVSNEASFHDDQGAVVSAFDQDLVIIKAIARHDLGVRHSESIAVLTGCLWGSV
jgi:HK97 family phage major capsid protein